MSPHSEIGGSARLQLHRSVLELSQVRLGEAIGLTFQQVQEYERGATWLGRAGYTS